MRMNISVGEKTFPIEKSLECQSMIRIDEKQKLQYPGVSFYIEDKFSDWILKTIDPEFV